MKRIFDLVFSLLFLILSIPFFLIISVVIKLDSPGPVFFKQKRIGKNGRIFALFKFRSMRLSKTNSENMFEIGNISRVTKFGKFIRKNKIDELPQFINVLRGEMSIVGPRPEVEEWINIYQDRWKRIHGIRPGITDNASLLYRDEEKLLLESKNSRQTYQYEILPRKLDLYEEYLMNHSFWGDIKIIYNTILILFKSH